MRASLAIGWSLALAVLCAAGCARESSPGRAAEDAAARAQALITAGNQAYRSGDYELAAKRYAAAAVAGGDDPAAYFGMGMALTKLGRSEEARSAYAHSRELAARDRRQSATTAHP
jgi:Flp pilus assembly protein TadD